MAERRMFAKRVVHSGRFLRMTAGARLLYYDLGMEADDDGVVDAFTAMRTARHRKKSLEELTANGYLTPLDDRKVIYINDWKINNQIRKDRYQPSLYRALLEQQGILPTVDQDDNQRETQDRLGKDRIDKEREEKEREGEARAEGAAPAPAPWSPPSLEDVRAYCWDHGLNMDPQAFLDYYTARDWKLSRGLPMTDWQAALRTWERRGKEEGYGISGTHPEPEYERIPSVADDWFD